MIPRKSCAAPVLDGNLEGIGDLTAWAHWSIRFPCNFSIFSVTPVTLIHEMISLVNQMSRLDRAQISPLPAFFIYIGTRLIRDVFYVGAANTIDGIYGGF